MFNSSDDGLDLALRNVLVTMFSGADNEKYIVKVAGFKREMNG